ncbi:MAG TPA: ABC transporter permease, partial [Erysipelotrichaceae bacterium]|nr:ABC transporter permease [Erysipelotrichaceae bacterium]
MSRHKKEAIWYTLLSLSVFIFLWYAYVTFFHIPSFILPTPTAVAKEMVFQLTQMDFYKNLLYTLSEVLFGFALSVLFGIIVGYCIGKHPHIKQLSMPLLVFFQVSPKIALIPIFIIWFGLGYGSKLFIVFIMSFFPIIEGVLLGLGHIPKEMYAYMQ